VLLVVEDDLHFAGVIRSIAHEKDFKIVVASHAEEAMMLAKRYKPSAITLDVKLPGTHGLVLLDQLKNDPDTRHIPVTILSVVEDLPRHQRKGALSQMTKPVSREQVDASITQMTAFADRKIKTLLVVEDDDAERLSISELLAGDDVKVTSLNSAKAVIEALQSNRYDCAVVDLGLPDMDGYELVRRIRKELGDRNMPIVVHTGRDLNEKELDELNVVADAVIVKDMRSLNRLLHETAIFLHRSEAQMPEEARRRLLEHDSSEASLAGRKVLIVDDDIRNIFAVTSLLERHGMEILYAESGQEGIDTLVKSTDVDAVLMDIMMPGMDGYETTRTMRKMQRFKDLPIIAVTAKAMKGDREKCIEAGASDYITKPVNVEQLISILRLWVSS
jgi:CheY-like chemotaxis protein